MGEVLLHKGNYEHIFRLQGHKHKIIFITTDGQTPPYDDRIFILLLFTRVGSMPKHSLTIFSDNDPLMFGDFRYFIVRETMYNVI